MRIFTRRGIRRPFDFVFSAIFTRRSGLTVCVFFIWTIVLIAGTSHNAYARNGDLDPAFGSGGKIVTDFAGGSDYGRSVAIQADGKILIVGTSDSHAALARYNADGSPDQTFGSGGKVVVQLYPTGEGLTEVVLQPDGKILAAGSPSQGQGFILARFDPNGGLDPGFGTGGFATATFGDQIAEAEGVVLQPDGKIIVIGSSGAGYGSELNDFAIARFNADGSVDQNFGSGGKLKTHFSGQFNTGTRAAEAVLQPDGKLIVAGSYKNEGTFREIALARYNTNGTLDNTFGGGGMLSTAFGGNAHGNAVRLQSDGKIVAAGYFETARHNNDMALARYDANGALDTTFGNGGKVIKDLFGSSDDIAYALSIQRDGKLVAVGRTGQYPNFRVGVARFNSNGDFDSGFGNAGKVLTDFGLFSSQAYSSAIQEDGKIVVGGYGSSGSADFILARYLAVPNAKQFDFDGDAKADVSVYRGGTWYLDRSTAGFYAAQFGLGSDKVVPADYDGDGKTDIAVFRPSEGNWYRLDSSTGTFSGFHFGLNGDIPVPGDYDADGYADYAVFRAGTWYIQRTTLGFFAQQFGLSTDRPTPGDFDGDSKTDVAVYRDGDWYIDRSTGGFLATHFGLASDRALPADYDADGKADIAVWRPGEGVWYVFQSATGTTKYFVLGVPSDIPVPADYDGDGKADFAVYRGSGTWWIWQSAASGYISESFGLPSDVPIPSAFVQ
jgi:uncharacterized delta-60 repeat protein